EITFVKKRGFLSSWMGLDMDIPRGAPWMRSARSFCRNSESRKFVFGTINFGVSANLCETAFSMLCRKERPIPCLPILGLGSLEKEWLQQKMLWAHLLLPINDSLVVTLWR